METRPCILKAKFKGSLRKNTQTNPKISFLIKFSSINHKTVAEARAERARVEAGSPETSVGGDLEEQPSPG